MKLRFWKLYELLIKNRLLKFKEDLKIKKRFLKPYILDLEKLREFRKVLRSIINLGGEIHLFLDSEDDEVSLNFLDNTIASQEDTKNYIEEEDAFLHDEDE